MRVFEIICWVEQLQRFTAGLNPICTTQRQVMTGKNVGNTFRIPLSPMPSLRELGLDLYPEYTTQELSMYVPKKINYFYYQVVSIVLSGGISTWLFIT